MTKDTVARIKIVLAMTTIGTIGLFAKNIDMPSSLYALCRAVMAAVVIGLYLVFSGQRIKFSEIKKEIFLFLLSGISLGLNWSFLFEAYQHIPYAVATLCDYFAPVLIIALCPVLYKEKITLKQIVCFVAATIGLMMLIGLFSGGSTNLEPYGVIMGVLAMCAYVPVLIINKLIKNVTGISRTFLQFSGAAVVLLLFSIARGNFDFSNLTAGGWVSLVVIGVLHTGIAYCLYFSALPHLPGQEGAILSYIDPLVAVLVSVLFMHESMSALQLTGALLLLGFTLGNEISFKKE